MAVHSLFYLHMEKNLPITLQKGSDTSVAGYTSLQRVQSTPLCRTILLFLFVLLITNVKWHFGRQEAICHITQTKVTVRIRSRDKETIDGQYHRIAITT